jgi:hypothetical protein
MGAYCGAYNRGVRLCSVWYRARRAIFKFHTSGHLQLRARPIARLSTRRGHRLDLAVTYCTRIINIYEIRQNDGASGEPCGSGMVDDRYVNRASEALKTHIDSAFACRLNVSSTR